MRRANLHHTLPLMSTPICQDGLIDHFSHEIVVQEGFLPVDSGDTILLTMPHAATPETARAALDQLVDSGALVEYDREPCRSWINDIWYFTAVRPRAGSPSASPVAQ